MNDHADRAPSASARGRSRWLAAYRTAAVVAVNTALLFLLLNLLALPVARARGARPAPRADVDLRLAYPGWPPEKVRELLEERDRLNGWEYEAFTEFRQRPVEGRYVNVNARGFRKGRRDPPWPPSPASCAVFFFGGSCAFGDRLPDDLTIPAALEELLVPTPSCRSFSVYNFGRPGYYSSQERILFGQLLGTGAVPGIAVFFDGLNEFFYEEPPRDGRPWRAARTADLDALVRENEGAGSRSRLLKFLAGLPAVRLARSFGRSEPDGAAGSPKEGCGVAAILDRWGRNRRLVEGTAAAFGVRPLFVWQPVPAYRYDVRFHLEGRLSPTLDCVREGYEAFATRREREPDGDDFLWLADMQEGRRENLYVDQVHFTAAFSEEVGRRIAAALSKEP